MKPFFYFLPVLAGMALATQAIVNGQLRTAVGSPLIAALISFITGTAVLLLLTIATHQSFPSLPLLKGIHWVKLTGGLLGVVVVSFVILSIQKIPSAHLFALLVTSQLITAVLFDHYGWLGIKESPITFYKVIGVLLLVAGAYLVNKK
jgi:bacterial/archaeal transporter family-2 protein